jgi:hypothetical protein
MSISLTKAWAAKVSVKHFAIAQACLENGDLEGCEKWLTSCEGALRVVEAKHPGWRGNKPGIGGTAEHMRMMREARKRIHGH